MKRVTLIALCLFLASSAAGQSTSKLIMANGDPGNRINVVFLSEGYTTAELGKFETDAFDMLNAMFTTDPWARFDRYFNAYTISVASTQSGSDHPDRQVYRDTYFNSSYGCYGIQRLICIDGEGGSKVSNLLMEHVPEYDIVVVIVNDPEYGGAGGFPAIASTSSASREVVMHELGHSFSGLADEYEDPYPGWYPYETPNSTWRTVRADIPWSTWIEASTPIPTPATTTYEHVVGLFEGAQYQTTGWYRPKLTCKMRVLGVAFCEVCTEAIAHTIYTRVSPIDGHDPSELDLVLTAPHDFRIDRISETDGDTKLTWTLDGVPVEGTATFRADPAAMAPGTHRLVGTVTDDTQLIRKPEYAAHLLWTVSWDVTVPDATDSEAPGLPRDAMAESYPNPARNEVTVPFTLSRPGSVAVRLFDMTGRLVVSHLEPAHGAGPGLVRLDVSALAPGIYLCRFEANGHVATRTIAVVR